MVLTTRSFLTESLYLSRLFEFGIVWVEGLPTSKCKNQERIKGVDEWMLVEETRATCGFRYHESACLINEGSLNIHISVCPTVPLLFKEGVAGGRGSPFGIEPDNADI